MTYTMSRDYDALYDLLCAGGEALGQMNHYHPEISRKMTVKLTYEIRQVVVSAEGTNHIFGEHPLEVSRLKSWMKNMNLEWLAPVDLAAVLEAGDKSLSMWRHELNGEGWESSSLHDSATDNWTTATAKFRKQP